MTEPLTILSIDPSSIATGYAILRAGKLIEAGVIRPKRTAPANDRIREMAAELASIRAEHCPDVVVIEDTSGKVGARHGGGGAGLAVYGKAVGWIIAEAERWAVPPKRVVLVRENDWTGSKTKIARASRISLLFPQYDSKKDGGLDAADAIGLAEHFASDLRYRAAVEAALRK